MQRISVVGNGGSGKTTVAKAIATALGVPHLELDGVFHQANWQPLDTEDFRRVVSEFTAGEAWVVDGNYSAVQEIEWRRAENVGWVGQLRDWGVVHVVVWSVRCMWLRVGVGTGE